MLMAAKDLVGEQFGRLTVIEKTDKRGKDRRIIWRCICKCGNEVEVNSKNLIHGDTKSCGCLKKEKDTANFLDITGKQFGKLTAIEKTDKRDKNSGTIIWKFKCECGNIIECNGTDVRRGNTLSCGCIKSKGEQKIQKILTENHINFIKEKTFETCEFQDTKAKAKFDFYLPELNYIIEFDGSQHFNFNSKGWNTEEHFNKTKEHDDYKNEWCKNNEIPLIRIPYTQLEKITLKDLLLESTNFLV